MPIVSGTPIEGVSEEQNYTEYYSNTIFTDGTTTITRAKIILPTTRIPDGCEVWLSADGGSNYESTSWNEWHTFTNTGTNLKYKLRGVQGSTLRIENGYGRSVPIRVEYKTRT